MAPLELISTTTTSLTKRWGSCDSYYDTRCGTHRTVILVISVAVAILVVLVFFLFFLRHQRRKRAAHQIAMAQDLEKRTQHDTVDTQGMNLFEPPPAYMPRSQQRTPSFGVIDVRRGK